ncbi:unnamed protein product, partial [Hymenolepis diminuta]|uniref:Reverse transcriptase domain-containing protein n=1 Tax=Hymenolepis diminuta TaxID=6216 RepID=A0A0R3SM68_HYMDI
MEQDLSTPFETVEPFDPPPVEEPTYTDVPPKMYEQAMTHTPRIRHHGTKIPMPKNRHANYPTRNTPVERWSTERWSKQKDAHELYKQLKDDKENLREFGESVARAVHLNRSESKVTLNEIKKNLHRYDTRKPHTRSQTVTGRRSDLLQLPLNKKSSNYESLMEAIRKWQDNLRNNPLPDHDLLRTGPVDVFKYEALLYGVDFLNMTCTAKGAQWLRKKFEQLTAIIVNH